MLKTAVDSLGWDENVAHDLDNAVGGNTIFNGDAGEAINLDVDVAAIAGDIDA